MNVQEFDAKCVFAQKNTWLPIRLWSVTDEFFLMKTDFR